jgi:hypothetical protein
VRNRLLSALRACDSVCSPSTRNELILHAHAGAIDRLIEIIEDLNTQPSFQGRGYKSKAYNGVWAWYQAAVHERDEGRCQHCGKFPEELVDPYLHLDHVVPLSKGGLTKLSNLQMLCSSCNSKKGRRSEDELTRQVSSAWFKNRTQN